MRTAKKGMALTNVRAKRDTRKTETHVQISMSVVMVDTTATLPPSVQTLLDHLTVAVSLDTLEMDETFAQITGQR